MRISAGMLNEELEASDFDFTKCALVGVPFLALTMLLGIEPWVVAVNQVVEQLVLAHILCSLLSEFQEVGKLLDL